MSEDNSLYPSNGAWDMGTTTPENPARSAPNWRPNGNFVVLPQADPQVASTNGWQKVASAKPGRKDLLLRNHTAANGGNDCLIAESGRPQTSPWPFEPGAVLTMDTEGEVWVLSAAGTIIDAIETWYPIVTGQPGQGGAIPYVAPLLP